MIGGFGGGCANFLIGRNDGVILIAPYAAGRGCKIAATFASQAIAQLEPAMGRGSGRTRKPRFHRQVEKLEDHPRRVIRRDKGRVGPKIAFLDNLPGHVDAGRVLPATRFHYLRERRFVPVAIVRAWVHGAAEAITRGCFSQPAGRGRRDGFKAAGGVRHFQTSKFGSDDGFGKQKWETSVPKGSRVADRAIFPAVGSWRLSRKRAPTPIALKRCSGRIIALPWRVAVGRTGSA